MRHSHGTLTMKNLLPGEYNLTLEALNGFGGVDRSPVLCPFRVLAAGETVNETQVRGGLEVMVFVGTWLRFDVKDSFSQCRRRRVVVGLISRIAANDRRVYFKASGVGQELGYDSRGMV